MTDQPSLFSFAGFFKLTRVWNLLIIVFTQVFASIFLLEIGWVQLSGDYRFYILLLTTIAIAAGGYVINDYYDVKIDFINKPERVVVGRTLKRRSVMVFHLFLNGIGIVGGFLVSWPVFAANIFSIGLLWLYSNQLKRMPLIGNVSIAILTSLSIWVLAIYFRKYTDGIIVYSLFAFFFTLVREIVKDIQDLKGDEEFGCKTLPIVWGVRKTKRFIFLLMVLFTAGVFLFLNEDLGLFWDYFLIGLLGAQILLAWLIYRSDTIKQMGEISQLCKWIMMVGILTMILFY